MSYHTSSVLRRVDRHQMSWSQLRSGLSLQWCPASELCEKKTEHSWISHSDYVFPERKQLMRNCYLKKLHRRKVKSKVGQWPTKLTTKNWSGPTSSDKVRRSRTKSNIVGHHYHFHCFALWRLRVSYPMLSWRLCRLTAAAPRIST
jgi:hypothetical protein